MTMSINFDAITPLRLVQGSHPAGSGVGCAMNALSFITGEAQISDFPVCSAQPLARMVQFVNDMLAEFNMGPMQKHLEGTRKFLSPEDSILALDLAWSTVGTADTDPDTLAVWGARILNNAQAVLSHAEDSDHAYEMWLLGNAHALKGHYVEVARCAVNAVFIATDVDALVVFVEDAIRLWKELNDVADVPADVSAVNAGIDRMVSV